jgi:hypothetical protein
MGLDAYGYSASEPGVRAKWWENAKWDKKTGEYVSTFPKHHEIQYWRKHHKLQEWMHNLWDEKGRPGAVKDPHWGEIFNGVELELTWNDIQRLQDHINDPKNKWHCYYYNQEDIQFCLDAKEQIFLFRKRVFYNSSW